MIVFGDLRGCAVGVAASVMACVSWFRSGSERRSVRRATAYFVTDEVAQGALPEHGRSASPCRGSYCRGSTSARLASRPMRENAICCIDLPPVWVTASVFEQAMSHAGHPHAAAEVAIRFPVGCKMM